MSGRVPRTCPPTRPGSCGRGARSRRPPLRGPGRLSWSPDDIAADAGHRGWELAPRDVVEVEVSDARFAPQLRMVRPGRAIAVHVSLDSARRLADSLRRNGVTVAD